MALPLRRMPQIAGALAAVLLAAALWPASLAAEDAAKTFRSEKHGFAFDYPADWAEVPQDDPWVPAFVEHPDGMSCNVMVTPVPAISAEIAADPALVARLLDGVDPALAYVKPIEGGRAEVLAREQVTWGGRPADRTEEVYWGSDEDLDLRNRTWITIVPGGLVHMLCGGPPEVFGRPASQDALALIERSFRFGVDGRR